MIERRRHWREKICLSVYLWGRWYTIYIYHLYINCIFCHYCVSKDAWIRAFLSRISHFQSCTGKRAFSRFPRRDVDLSYSDPRHLGNRVPPRVNLNMLDLQHNFSLKFLAPHEFIDTSNMKTFSLSFYNPCFLCNSSVIVLTTGLLHKLLTCNCFTTDILIPFYTEHEFSQY